MWRQDEERWADHSASLAQLAHLSTDDATMDISEPEASAALADLVEPATAVAFEKLGDVPRAHATLVRWMRGQRVDTCR